MIHDTESLKKPSPKALEQSTSVAASMIFHLTLISALALSSFPVERKQQINTIVTGFPVVETIVEPIELEPSSFNDDSSRANSSVPHFAQAFTSQISDSPVDVTPKTEQATSLILSPVGIPVGNLAEQVTPLVAYSTNGESGGAKGVSGDGAGAGAFFGMNLKGASVVFVVDASSSMNHPLPGPAKTRFGRVKIELFKAISKMTDAEKFFMIFFNEFSIPMPAARLISATPENRQLFLNWMAPGQAAGDTEPEAALLAAIHLRPEVIYFLTDGKFKYSVVQNVSAANQAGVVINTICFGNDTGEKFLKQLAQRNGGVYRFVPDDAILDVDANASTPAPPQPPGISRLPSLEENR